MKKVLLSISLLLSYSLLLGMDAGAGAAAAAAGAADGKEEESSEGASALEVRFPQVHVSPHLKDVLIRFIQNEHEKIRGAWYRFTLQKVADAMVVAKKRGVRGSLIVDKGHFDNPGDFCYPLRCMCKKEVKIYRKVRERRSRQGGLFEIMHHKFMIFNRNVGGKKLVWTGSFNPTGQADLKNCENVVILDDPKSVARFEEEFKAVRRCSDMVTAEQCVSGRDKTDAPVARAMNGIPARRKIKN